MLFRSIGKQTYRSPAQRTAVRSAITMRPGGALLICLPTGEGKSLVFDSIDAVGFTDNRPGVTVVVVPTIALALDHEKSVQSNRMDFQPRAYVGGDTEQNQIARKAITNGIAETEQGLYFVSPEAACTTLRSALIKASKSGRLKALVIDEAHLIEGWGADFRTEYQLLSALRAELLSACPVDQGLRTVLLSATISQMAVDTLKTLFSGTDGTLGIVYGSRLRPELQFFSADVSSEEVRRERVVEALFHLPRPLILYVSKVEHAIEWHHLLTNQIGFQSVGLMHGRTDNEVREEVLQSWRQGDLDVVVGTSAFGLGIDYAHVRAVVHACIPETMDRFYQEVGRGGRDGHSSLSVLIPADVDWKVAENLNQQKIITTERGRERWDAMFSHPDRQSLGGNHHKLRINVAPGEGPEDLDMVGGRSADWNARVLTVMARAGMLRLLAQERDGETKNDFISVEILQDGHRNPDRWKQLIEELRKNIRHNSFQSLSAIRKYISGNACPQDLLKDIYTININGTTYSPVKDCRGCSVCGNRSIIADLASLPVPNMPWSSPLTLHSSLTPLFDAGNHSLVVYYPPEVFSTRRFTYELSKLLHVLSLKGLRNLFWLCAADLKIPDDLLAFAKDKPYFVSFGSHWASKLLPDGPEIVIITPGWQNATSLPSTIQGCERLVLMPNNMRAPNHPEQTFQQRYNGADMTFKNFWIRVML